MSWATLRSRSLEHPRRSRRRHALRRRHRPPARGGWTSPGNGCIASTRPRAPTAPGSLAGMSLQVSGVASAASFGGSGERAPPAVQRAALEQARSHGSSCTLRDLGCHHPLASSRTMMQPVRLQQVQPKSAATRADATTRPCVELAYSQGWNNALYQVCSPGPGPCRRGPARARGPAITLGVYAHVIRSAEAAAADIFADAVNAGSGRPPTLPPACRLAATQSRSPSGTGHRCRRARPGERRYADASGVGLWSLAGCSSCLL